MKFMAKWANSNSKITVLQAKDANLDIIYALESLGFLLFW